MSHIVWGHTKYNNNTNRSAYHSARSASALLRSPGFLIRWLHVPDWATPATEIGRPGRLVDRPLVTQPPLLLVPSSLAWPGAGIWERIFNAHNWYKHVQDTSMQACVRTHTYKYDNLVYSTLSLGALKLLYSSILYSSRTKTANLWCANKYTQHHWMIITDSVCINTATLTWEQSSGKHKHWKTSNTIAGFVNTPSSKGFLFVSITQLQAIGTTQLNQGKENIEAVWPANYKICGNALRKGTAAGEIRERLFITKCSADIRFTVIMLHWTTLYASVTLIIMIIVANINAPSVSSILTAGDRQLWRTRPRRLCNYCFLL